MIVYNKFALYADIYLHLEYERRRRAHIHFTIGLHLYMSIFTILPFSISISIYLNIAILPGSGPILDFFLGLSSFYFFECFSIPFFRYGTIHIRGNVAYAIQYIHIYTHSIIHKRQHKNEIAWNELLLRTRKLL